MVFFCCGKVFFSAFFSSKCVFFLNHAGESQVLQILIAISEFFWILGGKYAIQLSSGLKNNNVVNMFNVYFL